MDTPKVVLGYFFFSSEQLKFRKNTEEKLGRKFKPGQVIVYGTKTSFTELSYTGKSRFSDAKIVAMGDVSSFRYTLPSNS